MINDRKNNHIREGKGTVSQEAAHIYVAFSADERYVQHAAVAMASILDHTAEPSRLHFFLFFETLSEQAKARVGATVRDYGAVIDFCPIESNGEASYYVSGQLSKAIYFRLQIPKLLPNKVGRVLYLDCDLLVYADIAELWAQDMKGKAVAAVPDFGIMASHREWGNKQRNLGFAAGDLYFNSGVLLMDVDAWRTHHYSARVAELAAKNAYRHHDQDALNVVFHRNWTPLPLRWNVIPPVWQLFLKVLLRKRFRIPAIQARTHIAVLHYAGGYKPWEYKPYDGFNDEYYRLLEKTAFCDVPMPQFDARRKGRSIQRQLFWIRMADWKTRIFSS